MLEDRKIKLFEVDNGKLNSTQRNNEYTFDRNELHVNASTTCNVTSMCMALEYLGYTFPDGECNQPEDNLAKFIIESPEVDNLYKTKYPSLYKDYSVGKKASYAPIEIHDILNYGVNLWMGKDVTEFIEYPKENFDITLKSNLENGLPLVVSGVFNKLHHVVCITGIVTIDDKVEFVKIDDPYGNFRNNYEYGTGNDIWLTYDETINVLRPNNSDKKMYHSFKKPE